MWLKKDRNFGFVRPCIFAKFLGWSGFVELNIVSLIVVEILFMPKYQSGIILQGLVWLLKPFSPTTPFFDTLNFPKGSSIYNVHKKIKVFPTCPQETTTSLLVDDCMLSTRNTHHSLEIAIIQ